MQKLDPGNAARGVQVAEEVAYGEIGPNGVLGSEDVADRRHSETIHMSV
jgi:hypothetical protein